jgi:hypothetical protein
VSGEGDKGSGQPTASKKKFNKSAMKTVTKQSMSLPGDLTRKFEPVPHCYQVCCLTLDKMIKSSGM